MSLLRSVKSLNCLPLAIYLFRFFDAYEKYCNKEIERIANIKHSDHIQNGLKASCMEFLEGLLAKIMFSKIDTEIIMTCVKFLRYMDSEYTIMRMEMKRVKKEDAEIVADILDLEDKCNKARKEVAKLEKELECWKTLLRMRNINVIPLRDKRDTKFCLDDEELLRELPSELTKKAFTICENFLQESRYALALAFLEDSIDDMARGNQLKMSPDIATLYGYLGQIYSLDGNNVRASENYNICLDFRATNLKSNDPSIVTVLYNYSLTLIKSKKLTEAETKLKDALSIKIDEVGPNHIIVAKINSLLGQVTESVGKSSDAISHYQTALSILEIMSLEASPFYTGICVSLCRSYVKAMQGELAEKIMIKLFNQLKKKSEPKIEESVFDYLRKHLYDAVGEYIINKYGSIDQYDICHLMEFLMDYFKSFPVVLKAIDTWKLFSLQEL